MASLPQLGRGLFRKGGGLDTSFTWLPDWERKTRNAIEPGGRKISDGVYDTMVSAMRQASRRTPGGGVVKEDEGWSVSIGTPAQTHTHWHLLEFGGGFHYARAPVRRAVERLGHFKPLSK